MSQDKRITASENANNKLKVQLGLIKKIVKSILIESRHRFPEILLYQITKYVFQNPLRLRKALYCPTALNQLKINNQHLLRRTNKKVQNPYPYQNQNVKDFSKENITNKSEKQKEKDTVWVSKDKNTNEYTAYITINKSWKATILNQSNYNQVLQKARLFFVFLSNVKLFSGQQLQKDNEGDPLNDFHNYQKKQKEQSKYHHLICDNFQMYYSYFQQIFKYQKDKKINSIVIKAFVNLMSKNMALIKIQKNYNTESLQCESKYLYIENKEEIPLKLNRTVDQNQFPSLRFENGLWAMVDQRGTYIFEVFEEVTYPLPWGIHSYLTRHMNITIKIDIWIEEYQNH